MSEWTDSSQKREFRSSSTDAALCFKTKSGFRGSLADAPLFFKTESGAHKYPQGGVSWSNHSGMHLSEWKKCS